MPTRARRLIGAPSMRSGAMCSLAPATHANLSRAYRGDSCLDAVNRLVRKG